MDGIEKGKRLTNIQICRFKYPRFPSDETKVIIAMHKDTDEKLVRESKRDLNKIIKYLIRQTFNERNNNYSDMSRLKNLSFAEFLYEVGMVKENKFFEYLTSDEICTAKERYLKALSASVQGSATVILKRSINDLFTNGYNKNVMQLFKSNHDLQVCSSIHEQICNKS